MKVYILYAKENWITDTLVQEWITYNKELYTNDLQESDTIWILSHYIAKQIPLHIYKSKKVITTIHHIVPSKITTSTFKHFLFLNSITDFFHTNSYKNSISIQKYIQKPIKIIPLWHNEHIWKFLNNKKELRKKHKLDGFLIGSFQRDTEGASIKNSTFKPKLEKGPDIFIQCLLHLQKTHKNINVLLTGTRRQYVIKELKKNNIPYFFFEMCDFETLNELYNCLDLYIVSSRIEGGPRAINECALNKTPLLSTNVGISNLLCYPESIFDINDPSTILNSKINTSYNYNNSQKYTIENYMQKFTQKLFI
jgi:glycosyltransferase involved in cell wall biosynthesis